MKPGNFPGVERCGAWIKTHGAVGEAALLGRHHHHIKFSLLLLNKCNGMSQFFSSI